MNTQQPTDATRRCHYVSAIGSQCNAPSMTGEHFCYSHNPRIAPERLEAQRAGGRNRRQPEPPPRIPPNLPYVKLETRVHIQLVYEVTMNYVLQGQMDLRVANTIGYLAQGALATLDSQARADRLAKLDAERTAEKAQKAKERAEKKAEKEAKAAQAQSKAGAPPGFFECRDKYGRRDYRPKLGTIITTEPAENGSGSETAKPSPSRPEFASSAQSESATATIIEPRGSAGASLEVRPPSSTATRTHNLPQPTTPPAQPEKPKRDRYTPTETEWPEVPTY